MTIKRSKSLKNQSLKSNSHNHVKNSSLLYEQSILEIMTTNPNTEVIHIKISPENFRKNFNSVSNFWRGLKNGLYSINGISNRQYFRNLSGFYLQIENKQNFEILIIHDGTVKLNRSQVVIRIKKLLGYKTDIRLGSINDFENEISEIMTISKRFQTFGDYYFHKPKN